MNEYTKDTITWSDNGCPLNVSLPTPNHISAAYRNGMVVVYGMIEKKGTPAGKPTEYVISELSPTVRYFADKEKDRKAMTTTINKLAVVGDQTIRTWFYYLKETTTGPLELKSYYVKEGNPSKQDTITQAAPHEKSRLAALYLPETNFRIVIFQNQSKGLSIATISDSSIAVSEISNTLGALEGTPLTVSYSGTDQNRHLYLYYASNVFQLTKTVAYWSGSSWVWTTQTTILGTNRFIRNTSQLAVTQEGKANRLFFMEKDSDIYEDISEEVN